MRVLIGCEFSGRVRDAFTRAGHYAVSCDLEPSETAGLHIQEDLRKVINDEWDLLIAFPPCTYLSRAGAHLWAKRTTEAADAARFVYELAHAPIHRICIENPVGQLNRRWRYPDQTIQPFFFGDPERKTTNLWLKNLPPLIPTNVVTPNTYPKGRCWIDNMGETAGRSKARSRTFEGIAEAMARQWGGLK